MSGYSSEATRATYATQLGLWLTCVWEERDVETRTFNSGVVYLRYRGVS